MRKSKVLTKALAAILCIAMLIPMAVTVGAAETGSEPRPPSASAPSGCP